MLIIRSAFYQWVKANEASKELGYSENSLNCWRKCGYLKSGKHWKFNDNESTKEILYNLPLCAQEMSEWWGRTAFTGP